MCKDVTSWYCNEGWGVPIWVEIVPVNRFGISWDRPPPIKRGGQVGIDSNVFIPVYMPSITYGVCVCCYGFTISRTS